MIRDGRPRLRGIATLAALLALAVTLTGCTVAAGATRTPSATAQAIAQPATTPPAPGAICFNGNSTPPPSSAMWLGADGAWFHTGLVGPADSTTVAVMVHQSDGDFCGWWPYAVYLAQHGIRSMLIELCGYGDTRCRHGEPLIGSGAHAVLVAAKWARAHGATRVVAVGASMGGTTVIRAASEDSNKNLSAVADLSGPTAYADVDNTSVGHKITIASLFAVAPDDVVVSTSELEGLARAIRGPKPILYYDGQGHGWALLSDPESDDPFTPFADQLAAFIAG